MRLNLPPFEPKIRQSDGKAKIFDIIRKKYVALTPEEWVRQHLIHYLIEHLDFPKSLLSVENGLSYNHLAKRTDIVAYGRGGQALMIIECKSFKLALSNRVFEQSSIYNHSLQAPYLMISNGLEHYCCCIDHKAGQYEFLPQIPSYQEVQKK